MFRLYKDPAISLSSYMESWKINDAIKPKVWLKSGGTLVIQPTEALTVIDVNTGKAIQEEEGTGNISQGQPGGRGIAKQLRLRNLSGYHNRFY